MDKTSGFDSQLYLASREASSSLIWEGGRVGELRRTVNPFPMGEWVRIPPLPLGLTNHKRPSAELANRWFVQS